MINCTDALRATDCSPTVAEDSSPLSFLRFLLSLESPFFIDFQAFHVYISIINS